MKRILGRLNVWFALLLISANGVAWAQALAPEGPAVVVQPRLEPGLADLRQRLLEGGHSGEPFSIEVTDREAAETITWYLERHPRIPFAQPQVTITPQGIAARGVAEIAGLRVGLSGQARVVLREGMPEVTLVRLDVAGLVLPSFVQERIQAEIDAQFALAQDLPVVIEEFALSDGAAVVRGYVR